RVDCQDWSEMTATMRQVQLYPRCHERRFNEALVAKIPHGGRKLQGSRSSFFGDEIRQDLVAWLRQRFGKSVSRRAGGKTWWWLNDEAKQWLHFLKNFREKER
ncbi:hypothetical protein PanWU01x14_012230, partial [Parasponia andersonii]